MYPSRVQEGLEEAANLSYTPSMPKDFIKSVVFLSLLVVLIVALKAIDMDTGIFTKTSFKAYQLLMW